MSNSLWYIDHKKALIIKFKCQLGTNCEDVTLQALITNQSTYETILILSDTWYHINHYWKCSM